MSLIVGRQSWKRHLERADARFFAIAVNAWEKCAGAQESGGIDARAPRGRSRASPDLHCRCGGGIAECEYSECAQDRESVEDFCFGIMQRSALTLQENVMLKPKAQRRRCLGTMNK